MLMMTAVGTQLDGRHFGGLQGTARRLIFLIAAQTVLLPLAGLGVVWSLSLPPTTSAGLLLVGACPVGDIANLYTMLGRGNLALSIALNTLTCLLSAVSTAGVFAFYSLLLGASFTFAVPTLALVARLSLVVMVPVAAGMGLRHLYPPRVERATPILNTVCAVGIGLLLLYVLVDQHDRVAAEWRLTAVASVAFMACAAGIGLGVARACGMEGDDAATVGLIFMVRNVGLAAGIAITQLGRVEYASFATVYFLTEVPLVMALIALRRRQTDRVVRAAQTGDA